MKRTAVQSSNVKSIGWENNRLEVEFIKGGIYQYSPITEQCYRELMESESKGKYITENIKNNERVFCKKLDT